MPTSQDPVNSLSAHLTFFLMNILFHTDSKYMPHNAGMDFDQSICLIFRVHLNKAIIFKLQISYPTLESEDVMQLLIIH